ncbi:CRISPR-associated protein Cas4 [Halovenus sp. HT40]|uniref:CRISPR-associated protein Cas4 n=1 Tax=Halovenus sp. HT40 TaxID=3126691 RepID=UPI00300F2E30
MNVEKDTAEATAEEQTNQLPSKGEKKTPSQIIRTISSETFDQWYKKREFRQNIRGGTPYFNGPSQVKSPERHSPSSLLQCHRKTAYNQLNAPAEAGDPTGIFWIGSQFEEKIALPYLQRVVATTDKYVTNSLWVDFTESTDVGEIRIKGETDPVIVNADSEPLLLTEIKTKDSVKNIESPNKHHRAQAHAYMKGLSEKHSRKVTDAIILYGGRTNLDVQTFHVEFDPWFWSKTVVNWAEKHTEYRVHQELPPAEPEYNWECKFCSYRERCGKGDTDYEDIGPTGFLPGVSKYPKEKVVEYLRARDGAKLTPILAAQYPELTEEYQVHDWECQECSAAYPWDAIDWDSSAVDLPRCPECSDSEPVALLGGPRPADQFGGGKHGDE